MSPDGRLTLQEAIAHAEEVAAKLEKSCKAGDRKCAIQHRQLAGWLSELAVMRRRSRRLDHAAAKNRERT